MQNVRALPTCTGFWSPACFADMIAGLFRLIARWNERRLATRYLQTLNDYQLSDIGLRRSDILLAVHGEARPGSGRLDDF